MVSFLSNFISIIFLVAPVLSIKYGQNLVDANSQPSSANCTWKYVEQPLSHFEKSNKGYYKQRLCIYDGYYKPNASNPVFFYTGNESPVEEYVNNTGLMWTLAEKMNALIVFAEHRYFGESIPTLDGVQDCVAYLTSEEALADYAVLTNMIRRDEQEWGAKDSAIIAFGGSYGGMLASWMRTLYPSAIDGAIAASAPVWGFPVNDCPLDGSARVVSYATSSAAGCNKYCSRNLKMAYVLISDIGKTVWGRNLLTNELQLCSPLTTINDVNALLSYLQTPLFDLAEGSYPFATNYITFALTGSSSALLPPWAMTVMCDALGQDFGVSMSGSEEKVQFQVSDATKRIAISVNWDVTSNSKYTEKDVLQADGVISLLSATMKSIQVWYNVSGTQPTCIDWNGVMSKPAMALTKVLNKEKIGTPLSSYIPLQSTIPGKRHHIPSTSTATMKQQIDKNLASKLRTASSDSKDRICSLADSDSFDDLTAWNILTCNEGINLVNWRVQGVGGNDKLYWPPNVPRSYSKETEIPGSLAYCAYYAQIGLYGIPEKLDEWSLWLDTVYGGVRNQYTSNIVYTNGDLDPWMPAGVNMVLDKVTGKPMKMSPKKRRQQQKALQEEEDGIVSLLIEQGGHHLDLFWPTEQDPESVKQVRAVEEAKIQEWISQRTISVSGDF